MTTAERIISNLDTETRHRYAQAQREAQRDETALAMWAQLFEEGQYRRAAEWWWSEVEGRR